MKSTLRTLQLVSLLILILPVTIFFTGCKGKAAEKTVTDSTAAYVKPLPGMPIKYDSSKRYIYLTWDDAPQPPGTVICKRIFVEEGVKATFFVVGMHEFDHIRKNMVDSIRNGYPEFLLANHSYTHGFRNNYKNFYSRPDSAVKDFEKAQAELKVPVKIIRLPGNSAWVG